MKGLGYHDAVCVGDVDAGIGDSVENQIARFDLIVQDPEASDDGGVEIREQRVGDGLLLGEF